jgi:5'-nucleotidase
VLLFLLIAFDFHGVLADGEAETVFKQEGLERFHEYEALHQDKEHQPGLLADLFRKLSNVQELENRLRAKDKNYQRLLRTAIITACNYYVKELGCGSERDFFSRWYG